MTDITGEKRSLDDDGSVGASVKQQKLAGTGLNSNRMSINYELNAFMLVHSFTSPKVSTDYFEDVPFSQQFGRTCCRLKSIPG